MDCGRKKATTYRRKVRNQQKLSWTRAPGFDVRPERALSGGCVVQLSTVCGCVAVVQLRLGYC